MKLESLQSLLLAVAREQTLDRIIHSIVDGLAHLPDVALARIWLKRPGDRCGTCEMREECPDPVECLHLLASTDAPRPGPVRQPLGSRFEGRIAESGKPEVHNDPGHEAVREAGHGAVSVAGEPLLYRGEVQGVLAVFARHPMDEGMVRSFRILADHAAAAIAQARTLDEVQQLRQSLEQQNAYLQQEIGDELAFGEIVGRSSTLRKVLDQIELVAPTDAAVLILGESGTGKELVARAIHQRSQRSAAPFIKVNCGAIPRELFESEFFGHVKGAFTGAVLDRVGRFQLADGGTLFLDEVGEIPLDLQSKLLRVLQEGEFERVGEARTRHVDVRILAATNRDLRNPPGSFREDLYFRLSVFPIEVPPLRDRREDIAGLTRHFIRLACRQLNCKYVKVTKEHLRLLRSYDWPGNVRELQNVVERAVITSRKGSFDVVLPQPRVEASPAPTSRSATPATETLVPAAAYLTDKQLRKLERDSLREILQQTNWKIYGPRGAAELFGIKPTTLASRLKKLGIVRPA